MHDTSISELIEREEARQGSVINLIASENYISKDVSEALGSVFVNKYAEGYPGARYYHGNDIVDELENLAISRALEAFDLDASEWGANVQPLSGSPANVAAYLALVPPGGKIMGMSLDHGGHLTHGHKVSITGKVWQQVSYGVSKETEVLDYDELLAIAKTEQPKLIVAGYTAYPRLVDWKKFRNIADAVGAYLLVDMSHIAGLIAAGEYPSPFPYADVVTGTTHKTLRGPRSAIIFGKKGLMKKIDKAVFPGIQGGPHLDQIAGVAVALHEAMQPAFKRYIKQVIENADVLASELERLGWRIVSGGTDSHLVLVDTWMGGEGVPGKLASEKLEEAGIVTNMNTIPFDARTPMDPSGVRLGSAAETTRGKAADDFKEIAQKIDAVLKSR